MTWRATGKFHRSPANWAFLLACGLRRFCAAILLQSAKKRLHDAHGSGADFADGYVRSHGFLSVDALVGIIVQLENSSIEGDSGEQTFGAGIGVDRGIQQNVRSGFCIPADGSSRRGCVCADL